MTTNTTNNQDIDDLLCDLFEAGFDSPGRHESTQDYRKARDAILAHIDAKLAQAFNDGAIEGRIHQRSIDDKRIQAAESRLAEIQRGVEGLTRYGLYKTVFLQMDDYSIEPDEQGDWLDRDDVLALLQPQGQASDTVEMKG